MLYPLSVLGGLILAGYGIARLKTKRASKPKFQGLFGMK